MLFRSEREERRGEGREETIRKKKQIDKTPLFLFPFPGATTMMIFNHSHSIHSFHCTDLLVLLLLSLVLLYTVIKKVFHNFLLLYLRN